MRAGTSGGVPFDTVYGVDFSGAKLAGRNTWVARLEHSPGGWVLRDLASLERLCGTPEREPALAALVGLIAGSEGALWALDFPFGLPVEVGPEGGSWAEQIDWLTAWEGGAYALGLECVRRARRRGGPMHIFRLTDREARTPFDCYHYRIIYQTFHGMRDVLAPLCRVRGTAVLPFHCRRLPAARRVVVEACPSSTLKRLGLPHQNYKQPGGGPLTPRRRQTRRRIVGALARLAHLPAGLRLRLMRNPGGDALDAVLAALGAVDAFHAFDARAVARHERYPHEGYLFV